jgi:DNA-binding transcriptional LysR family regulator
VQLAELEREAGVKLLRRVGRGVQLTPAGWRVVEHAQGALEADEALRSELAAGTAPRGLVRVTFVQTTALALLPSMLAALPRELRVEVFQRESAPALDELRSRAVDLVVGVDYDPVPVPRHRDVERQDLLSEDVRMALPGGSGPVDLRDFADAAWAAGYPATGHGALVENVCNRLGGYAPDIRHRTDDALILRALVSSGRAVTILSALVGTATPQVVLRPIAQGQIRRTVFTAVRAAAAGMPSVVAVRRALREAAVAAVAGRDDVRVM